MQGGKLSWRDFLKLWTAGSEYDKGIVSTMVGLSKAELKEIVREKIQQRLPGGPAGLRRAFQFIDGDGSGSIDEGELRRRPQAAQHHRNVSAVHARRAYR